MAAVTTMKCSARRTALRRIQQLVNELVNVNEEADRVRAQMIATGNPSVDVAATVNAILAAGGPATMTTDSTGDKMTDRLINMLSASATDTVGQVGWTYEAE
jgi:hypothetical protein